MFGVGVYEGGGLYLCLPDPPLPFAASDSDSGRESVRLLVSLSVSVTGLVRVPFTFRILRVLVPRVFKFASFSTKNGSGSG